MFLLPKIFTELPAAADFSGNVSGARFPSKPPTGMLCQHRVPVECHCPALAALHLTHSPDCTQQQGTENQMNPGGLQE